MIDRAPERRGAAMGIIAILIAFFSLVLGFRALGLVGDQRIIREVVFFAFGIAVLIAVKRGERRPLSSMGLHRPTLKTLWWSIAATLALLSITACTYAALTMAGLPTPGGDGGSGNPLWMVLIIALRAAFVEELVFRGYVLERLENIRLGSFFAIVWSAGLFVAAHLSAKFETIFFLVPAAIFFGAVFVWKRDLVVCMVAHFVVDFVGLAAAAMQSK